MGWLKRLSARLRLERLRSLHTEEEISPERCRLWRLMEATDCGEVLFVAVQVIPVQLQ